jgi:hypothetical protein
MKKIVLLLVLLVTVTSCNTDSIVNKEQKKYLNNNNKYKLQYTGMKKFPLDEESTVKTQYISYIQTDSINIFSFVNNHNNAIYLYNYDSATLLKKIKYDKEGPDGVLSLRGYLYLNEDSIFVYSNNDHNLCLTNSNAKVLERYKLYDRVKYDENSIIYPSPIPMTTVPLTKFNNNVILFGFYAAEFDFETPSNRPVCVMLNLEDKSVKHLINYPEQYSKYNWAGGFTYRMPCYTLDDKSMIISFSAHHNLVRYDFETQTEKDFYAGSSAIKRIKPYSTDRNMVAETRSEIDWYMTNSSYESILYDKYNKIYYRIARLPVKNYTSNDSESRKPLIIIILDSELNYLGEVALDEYKNIVTANWFISEEGIHFQLINDDEENITFKQYKILPAN